MKLGIFFGGPTDVQRQVDGIVAYEADGFDSVYLGTVTGTDAMTVIALAGQRTKRLGWGHRSCRHTPPPGRDGDAGADDAGGDGRTLRAGVGAIAQTDGGRMLGLSYDRPAIHVREYITVLSPLLRGSRFRSAGSSSESTHRCVYLGRTTAAADIGAGAGDAADCRGVTDGTITWMTGPKTLERHVTPRITSAAAGAGRPSPRIVAGFPVVVTDDAAGAREKAARAFVVYGTLPNYQRMLEKEGASGPADIAIVGNEAEVERQIRAIASTGATELLAGMFTVGDDAQASLRRTTECLKGLVGKV
jgi:F420-dependent oxidoreductase-like protein